MRHHKVETNVAFEGDNMQLTRISDVSSPVVAPRAGGHGFWTLVESLPGAQHCSQAWPVPDIALLCKGHQVGCLEPQAWGSDGRGFRAQLHLRGATWPSKMREATLLCRAAEAMGM